MIIMTGDSLAWWMWVAAKVSLERRSHRMWELGDLRCNSSQILIHFLLKLGLTDNNFGAFGAMWAHVVEQPPCVCRQILSRICIQDLIMPCAEKDIRRHLNTLHCAHALPTLKWGVFRPIEEKASKNSREVLGYVKIYARRKLNRSLSW